MNQRGSLETGHLDHGFGTTNAVHDSRRRRRSTADAHRPGRGPPPVFTPAAIVLLELFMDLGASALTATALTTAVLPAYLLLHHDAAHARAAAVLAWLAGHALIAWCLRAQPALSWRRNPAFPIWATAAITVGVLTTCTILGDHPHLTALPFTALIIVTGCVSAAVAIAAAGRGLLRMGARL
jgi:hypothetical protein